MADVPITKTPLVHSPAGINITDLSSTAVAVNNVATFAWSAADIVLVRFTNGDPSGQIVLNIPTPTAISAYGSGVTSPSVAVDTNEASNDTIYLFRFDPVFQQSDGSIRITNTSSQAIHVNVLDL